MRGATRALTVFAVLAASIVATAPASARPRTQATIFEAFTSTGAPTIPVKVKSGYCYTGSLTINRNDAWRCLTGNFLYDPCFSSAKAPSVVICPNLQVNGGIEIRLTKPLPRHQADPGVPSLAHQPWDVLLENGKHCAFSSGASNELHGLRLNYFCASKTRYGLWGYPNRHVEPWTILSGPALAKSLHTRRAIRHAWM